MWIAYFCGFDGLAILRRLKKQSNNENDKQDESVLNDMPECVKTADKANVTNIKVLTPEEILELKSDSDAVQTCIATLNEIVITVPHGKYSSKVFFMILSIFINLHRYQAFA